MTLRRRVFTSSALNLCDFGLRFASVLVVSPFLIQQLGVEGYGVWFLIFSIATYLELLDLGLANTAVRFIGRSLGLRDTVDGRAAADRIFAWFKRLYRRIALVALLLAAAATAVAAWLSRAGKVPDDTGLVMALCAFPLALSFFFRPYRCLLKGHVLYHRLIAASGVRTIVFTVGVFIVLGRYPGIAGLAVLWACCALLEQILIWWLAWPVASRYRPVAITPGSILEAKEIGGYAGKQVAISLANFLRNRVDVQILGAAIGPVAVTYYAVGIRFVDLFKDLMTAIFGGNFLAAFAQMASRERAEQTTDRVLTILRLSSGLAASGMALLIALTPAFINRWLGPGFEQSHLVIYLLIPSVGLFIAQYPAAIYLSSINRHGILATTSLIGSVVNLALSIVLVLRFGFPGVVMATCLEMIIQAAIILPRTFCRRAGVSAGRYLASVFRGLFSQAPVALIAALLVSRQQQPGYLELAVSGTLLGCVSLACLLLLVLSAAERRQLWQQAIRLRLHDRDSI